ncbi:MAG: hypothetical protein WC880_04145 [Candidatus Paceibacterota bacterium]
MSERSRRFPTQVSLRDLEKGLIEYSAICPTGEGRGTHDWGTANAFAEFDSGGMAGHISILECSKCHKVIHVALTV